jgi:hypothetical protein
MTGKALDVARRAMHSSAMVPLIRPVIVGSAVCAAAASALQWLRRTRERIVVGLEGGWSAQQAAGTSRQLDAIASGSRVIGALASLSTAPSAALREAGAARLLDPILGLDLRERIRMSACIIVVAVLTHTVLLAQRGVPVHEVGWWIRVGLVIICVIGVRWPEPLVAAWRDRSAHLQKGHRA